MTTYGAYNAGLPCKNPSCKSHGKPHPNCRCYGEGSLHRQSDSSFAEGGEVEAYCSRDRHHNIDCEYYAGGGIVPADDMPQQGGAVAAQVSPTSSSSEVPAHDLPDSNVVPESDLPASLEKKKSVFGYEITPYRFEKEPKAEDYAKSTLSMYEGIGRGFAGPAGAAMEAGLAKADPFGIGMFEQLSPEKQKERKEQFPEESTAGELLGLGAGLVSGSGTIGAADKLAKAASNYANLGRTGSAIIKGMISNGVIQAGDEIADGILNRGNPEHHVGAALAHTGAAGVIGGILGGAASKTAQGLERIAETKLGNKISAWLAGFANAAKNPEAERAITDSNIKHYLETTPNVGGSYKDYLEGAKKYTEMLEHAIDGISMNIGAGVAKVSGNNPYMGAAMYKLVKPFVEGPIKSIAGKVSPNYVAPAVMQILAAGGKDGLVEALGHAGAIESGHKAISKGVDRLFQSGIQAPQKIYNYEKSRKKLEEWLDKGGPDGEIQEQIYEGVKPQGFAEGGSVQPAVAKKPGLEAVYPDQAMLMNAAKGRIFNYLNGLRPQKVSGKFPFDPTPDTKTQKKTYYKALDIAANPLSIVDEIHKGTIEADSIKHLRMMHPEVLGLLQSKATQKITEAQMKGTRPSYRVQQGLSMLLGTPLSSALTPEGIRAAQSVFASKNQAKQAQGQQPQGQVKKGTSALSSSDKAFLTGPQARTIRQQRT